MTARGLKAHFANASGIAWFGVAMFLVFVASLCTLGALARFSDPPGKLSGPGPGILILVWLVSGALTSIAGFMTGVQKGRTVLGIIAALIGPLGFWLAFAAKDEHQSSNPLQLS